MSVAERVKKIVVKQLDIDQEEVTDSATLIHDLGVDSLDMLEIAIAVELEFKIEMPDSACESFNTVGDISAFVDGQLSSRTQPSTGAV